MLLRISHTTQYNYDSPLVYGLQQARLTPVNSHHQTVLNWGLTITGGEEELSFMDHYQNHTTLVQATPGENQVTLTVEGQVETHTSDGIFGKVYGIAPLWHFTQPTPRTTAGRGIQQLAKAITTKGDLLSDLHALSQAILDAVPYGAAATTSQTDAEEALNLGGGVCQDHAQIFVAAARHAGVPARYVSGYLMMDDRVEQDASHAWAEAHIDGLGWVGFDISNGISPDERYVRLAVGRDSRDAGPLTGLRLGDAEESMIVSLQIQQ